MPAIEASLREGVTVLRLDRPPVNALDVETLDALSDSLDQARSSDADAVVITGTDSVFSAGADLRRVLGEDADYVAAGIDALTRAFKTLFTFPRPLVAAVNGHALAGGCIITCACDHRLIASSASIGAIELAAGVPFPAWALEVMRHAVPAGHLDDVILLGRAYPATEALGLGLVDDVVGDDEVLDRALEVAVELAQVPRTTYALTKAMLRQPAVELAERTAPGTDPEVKRAWASDEIRAAIERQMRRLGRG